MRTLLIALTVLVGLAAPSRAEQLITAISSDLVSITSNFTGTSVVVFGTIERDAQTVSRSSRYEVSVSLAGPASPIVVRRKERTVGLWINRGSERLASVPAFLAVHSTAPLSQIASEALRVRLGLGLDVLQLQRPVNDQPPIRTDFEAAFLRLMTESRLYQVKEDGVQFLSETLFRAPIVLPANVPVGDYVATVHLFRDGALLATTTTDLHIGKVGFEQWMTDLAHENGLVYGLATVVIACLTGWLAGVVFRRD